MKNITCKNILVTGAAGGMGRAVCRRMAECGCRVLGVDLRCKGAADGFDGEWKPGEIKYANCDVTDRASVDALGDIIKDNFTALDAVIHTAGIYDLDSLLEMDEKRFLRIFNVNLFGVYRINQAVRPYMHAGARIIITTSELAPLDPLPFTGVYGITKAALEKYAYSLRMESNLLGISVSVIRPGAVDTGLLGDSTAALDRFCEKTELYSYNADRFRHIVNSVEAKKIPPEKIADKIFHALYDRRPRYIYNINRNFLLLMLNAMPHRFQVFVIKQILKRK